MRHATTCSGVENRVGDTTEQICGGGRGRLLTVVLGTALSGLLVSLPARPAVAGHAENTDDSVEEVLVTADFWERADLEMADSISVIGELEIAARAAVHLEEILAIAPNVNFSGGASRARFYQIRGIGERAQFESPLLNSVGLLVDDADFSGSNVVGMLFDVAQVEVLRGPQGTRYGSNAMAGLIHVRTKAPSADVRGSLRLNLSSHGGLSLGGALGGPLTDRLWYRITAHRHKGYGYIRNVHLSKKDTNDFDESLGRLQLRWLASSRLQVDVSFTGTKSDNGYDAFSLGNNRITRSDEPGEDIRGSVSSGLKLAWKTDAIHVEALLHATVADIDYGYDEDWTYVGFHPDGYSSTDAYRRDLTTLSAELRLLSDPDRSALNWIAGLHLLDKSTELRRIYTYLPGPFESSYDTGRMAAFGELHIGFLDVLTAVVGLRVERWQADYHDSERVTFAPRDTLWGGRVSLQWSPREELLAYVSLARGYKATGFNVDGSLPADLRSFDGETLWNLESGLKALFADRLTVSLALFAMRRDDVQISSSIQSPPRPDGSVEFISFVGNAASGRNLGIEMELRWLQSEKLELRAGIGLVSSKYRDFVNSAGMDLSGREQAHAPGYQYHLALEYRPFGNWLARLELEGRDAFFFSDTHDARAKSSDLVHLRIGYEAQGYSISLWSRNLGNEDVQIRGFLFGNDPRSGYQDSTYVQLGEPRIYGVELRAYL